MRAFDLRFVVYKLRPGSRYVWLNLGDNNYASIGEWLDPNTTKPTEQEIQDWWNAWVALHADEDAQLEAKESARADIDARFLLSQLANKTPQEIYTLMQNRMDSWASLADARADLREWLPLMAAIIAWKVQ